MPRQKKDAKYLNVHIERKIFDRFNEFCKKNGQSKTAATELALKRYMDEMESLLKGLKNDAGKNI